MRNPERIDEICNRLAKAWKRFPDWRLGQLICNFQNYSNNDCFYREDFDFISELEDYINRIEDDLK